MKTILLLSGPTAVGKTTVSKALLRELSFEKLSTRAYIELIAEERGRGTDKASLQDLGDELDKETSYSWVLDEIAIPALARTTETQNWLLDCVRKPQQVAKFRAHYGNQVTHLHLTADPELLRARYVARASELGADEPSYDDVISHVNEKSAMGLINVADVCVDVSGEVEASIHEVLFKLRDRGIYAQSRTP